jgi:hypothetical protein
MGRQLPLADLVKAVQSDTQLQEQIKRDPVATLQTLANLPPFQVPDTWIYRIVVISLGVGMLAAVIGVLILSGYGKTAPDGVIAIGSAAVGALAGLLAPSPVQR